MGDYEKDEALLISAQEGDEYAFELLVKKYEAMVKAKIRLDGVRQEDVEDVFQITLWEAWKNIKICCHEKGGFPSHLRNIAGYKVKNFFDKLSLERKKKETFKEVVKHHSKTTSLHTSRDFRLVEEAAEEELFKEIYHKDIIDYCFEYLPSGGPPHMVLTFLYNRIIYADRNQTHNGNPQRIVRELSDKHLKVLVDSIIHDYGRISNITPKILEKNFEFMRQRISSREHGVEIGNKTLADYFGKNPEANISDWSYRVAHRIRSKLREKHPALLRERNLLFSTILSSKNSNRTRPSAGPVLSQEYIHSIKLLV